ncbi:MAG: TetR/AcrR family transcriptional regulator, partial [Candidatus Hydrogenedentes bacterium]|nr:TetR/AcrR family transcriptional regulator [Candidatus Hydrogenedentota bacterium]
MGIAARKRRAFKEREELILDAARSILLKRGYHGLTMDRIAEA